MYIKMGKCCKKKCRREPPPLLDHPVPKPLLQTVFIDTGFFKDIASLFMKELIENGYSPKYVRIVNYDNTSFSSFIEKLYNEGVRIFYSTANSQQCFDIFPFLQNHLDMVFVSFVSTVDFNLSLPLNFIRSSTNDRITFGYLLEMVQTNYFKEINSNTLITPTSQIDYNLVYTDDFYGNGYKKIFDNYNYKSYLVDESFPQELETKLNNTSTNQCFFLITENPQKVINLLNQQTNFYNHLFFLGDGFNNPLLTYNNSFKEAYLLESSQSELGDEMFTKYVSSSYNNGKINMFVPFLGNVIHVLHKHIGKNFEKTAFKILSEAGVIKNNGWHENVGIFQSIEIRNNKIVTKGYVFNKEYNGKKVLGYVKNVDL